MEPFDAIVSNLEQAQRRGLETVTNRLDFVVETLQELINEATSSVREAMPSSGEELFPLSDVRTAVEAAARRVEELEAQVAGLERRLEEAEAAASGPGGATLEVLQALDAARSQSDLLRALLPVLAEHAGRAVVLVLREGRVSAWSGIGFAEADRLRHWSGDAAASPVLEGLVVDMVPFRFDPMADPVFSLWLSGEPEAQEAVLVPVVLRSRLVGAIYIDRVEGHPWNPDVARSLVALACLLIDTLPYRQKVPFAPLADIVARGPETEADAGEAGPGEALPEPEAGGETPAAGTPVEPVAEEAPAPDEGPEAGESVPEPEPPAVEPEQEEVSGVTPQEEPRPEMEVAGVEAAPGPGSEPEESVSAYDPSATMRMDAATVASPAEESAQPVVPPPPVEQVEETPEDTGIPAELEPLHEEARRFARLLVSEIKLYNEDEVEQGRANHDIYQRLKDDIDRSREMYDQRVDPRVRESHDYFRDELVRILGDGDPEALGM